MAFIIQKEWFTTEQLRANPNSWFVFGDNAQREGTGGQAKVCRFEPNAHGIITKWDKYRNPGSYMYDQTYDYNVKIINEDFWQLKLKIMFNQADAYFPADGIGTGLANLKDNAPKTLAYIEWQVSELVRLHGQQVAKEGV